MSFYFDLPYFGLDIQVFNQFDNTTPGYAMIDSYDFFKVLSKYDVRFEHILEMLNIF